VVLTAAVIHAAISLAYSDLELYALGTDNSVISGFYVQQAPAFWRRVHSVTDALQVLQPLALALLFAAGLQHWSRAEGSWMRLIGISLAALAFAPGAFVVGAYAVLDRADTRDLESLTWMRVSPSVGLVAIGYFFLAYRAAQPVRTAARRRRPRPHVAPPS
jgi:hypothetical protein